jgi:hypothetical protein
MKNNKLNICTGISAVLFILFAGLYVYVLIADPKTYLDDSGIHWPNITIIHNVPITITNYPPSILTNSIQTNYPSYKLTSIDDSSVHIAVAKDDWYVGGTLALVGDNKHLVSEVSEKGWNFARTYFCIIKNIHRPDSWWTLEISLWYPIILSGILPAIFVVKKLHNRKSASTKETTIGK